MLQFLLISWLIVEFMKRGDAFNVTKLDLLNPRMNDGHNVNATIVFNTPAAISVEMVSL